MSLSDAKLTLLVSELLPSCTLKQRAAAANRLCELLQTLDTTDSTFSERLAANGAILPLLAMAQAVPRTPDFKPKPGLKKDLLAMADAALLTLSQLCDAATRILEVLGWDVVDDGSGRAVYVNPNTKEGQYTPPEVSSRKDSQNATGLDEQMSKWVRQLLLELPSLISPHVSFNASGSEEILVWPARVLHLERLHFGENSTSEVAASGQLGVVDVLEEEGNTVRQLVLGPWLGTAGFRETEMDMGYPPGCHLENWYAVTLAGLALFATEGEGRILTIGLGGGSLPSFLSWHAPGLELEAVEVSATVATTAQRFFGLRCDPSLVPVSESSDFQKSLPDSATWLPSFSTASESRTPCRVHVRDALDFASSPDSHGKFSAIILDVYTNGTFPSTLLTPEFFENLRSLLSDSSRGSIIVNAGTGQDSRRVKELLEKSCPAVRVYCDADTGLDEGQYENVVMVGCGIDAPGISTASDEDPIEMWITSMRSIRNRNPDTPFLPFAVEVVTVRPEDGALRLGWGANPDLPDVDASDALDEQDDEDDVVPTLADISINTLDDQTQLPPGKKKSIKSRKKKSAAKSLPVETLPENDAAWDVFN